MDNAQTPRRQRTELIEELYGLYGKGTVRMRLRFLRKKYAWIAITGSAWVIKRGLDITAALVALVLLSPFSSSLVPASSSPTAALSFTGKNGWANGGKSSPFPSSVPW